MANLELISTPTYQETLTQAVTALQTGGDRPAARTVVQALVQAEKAAKQQHFTYSLQQLAGHWQLYFVAPKYAHQKAGVTQGRGWYVPQFVPAQISFTPDDNAAATGTIANQIQFGCLQFKLTGLLKYPGKKNLLGFDFTQAELSIAGRVVYCSRFSSGNNDRPQFEHAPVSRLPFFAFFLVAEEFIAARGRGGGLALWIRSTTK